MSHQSSLMPDEPIRHRKNKKQHGKYELWARYKGYRTFRRQEWYRMRKYRTRRIAEENMKNFERKYNAFLKHIKPEDRWEFEIRVAS